MKGVGAFGVTYNPNADMNSQFNSLEPCLEITPNVLRCFPGYGGIREVF